MSGDTQTDLAKALDYARANGGFPNLQLVPRNRPFDPGLVGATLGD